MTYPTERLILFLLTCLGSRTGATLTLPMHVFVALADTVLLVVPGAVLGYAAYRALVNGTFVMLFCSVFALFFVIFLVNSVQEDL